MIKCEGAFKEENLVCETICPPGLLPEDDLEGLCKTFCSEETLVCDVRAIGGSQEVNVMVGDQTIGASESFIYKPPVLYSVFPPELAAGSSSLLTGMSLLFCIAIASRSRSLPYGPTLFIPSSPAISACPSLLPVDLDIPSSAADPVGRVVCKWCASCVALTSLYARSERHQFRCRFASAVRGSQI